MAKVLKIAAPWPSFIYLSYHIHLPPFFFPLEKLMAANNKSIMHTKGQTGLTEAVQFSLPLLEAGWPL